MNGVDDEGVGDRDKEPKGGDGREVEGRKGVVEGLEERFARVFRQSTAEVADEMQAEEALKARVRRKPEEPTAKEVEEHMMHHAIDVSDVASSLRQGPRRRAWPPCMRKGRKCGASGDPHGLHVHG